MYDLILPQMECRICGIEHLLNLAIRNLYHDDIRTTWKIFSANYKINEKDRFFLLFKSVIALSLPFFFLYCCNCLLYFRNLLFNFLVINNIVFILFSNLTIKGIWLHIKRCMTENRVATRSKLEIFPIFKSKFRIIETYKLFH